MEYQISPRNMSRVHHFGNEVLPSIFLGHELIADGTRKGVSLIADLENLEKLDASESTRKEYSEDKKMMSSYSFVADGTAKLSGRDLEF